MFRYIYSMKHLSFLISIFLLSYNTFSQVPHPSSGTIKQFVNFPSRYVEPRNVDVWLPENYSPAKNYAVLYMQDGQMLFDSTITWDHQEWGADETLSRLMAEKKIRNTIVVGIWSNGKYRHAEYSPQKALNKLSGKDKTELMTLLPDGPMGDNYLKFLVTELKPFIDSSFSTLKDQKSTFIAGSSMGGLISMYALCEYPSVFYGAACISTHWTVLYRATENSIPFAILDYMNKHLPSPDDHKFYF
jgi:predicted alpha/beta superfamily hydrolase